MSVQFSTRRQKTTQVFKRPGALTWVDRANVAARPRARVQVFGWASALLLVILGSAVYVRLQASSDAAEEKGAYSELSIRQVAVTTPMRPTSAEVVLPATLQAYQQTDLFARANGFLKVWHVDIGASVKVGQILAEIETPELDQELAQAAASLNQGRAEHHQSLAELEEANADLVFAEANVAKVQALMEYSFRQTKRYESLVTANTVSREEYEGAVRDRDARKAELASTHADVSRRKTNLDTRRAIIESKEAVVANRAANVRRLRDLTGFQKVFAPFEGVITRRNAEVGMLVTAGSNTGTRPLFSVAQVDVLRVQVAVPQSAAVGIRAGDQAQVTIPELPAAPLTATVTRTAGAVDPASRSMLVEVELPNPGSTLLPGIYAQVRFRSPRTQTTVVIPNQALLMRSAGPHVVVVASDGTLRTDKVTLGRDFGTSVEVLSGLQGHEQLVLNPTDDLRDGQRVQIAPAGQSGTKVAQK